MLLPQQEIQLPAEFEQQSPSEYLEALYQFVDKYRWLADLHVGDFITMKLWELLDPTWRQALLPDSFDSEEDYQAWFASILSLTKSDYCNVSALKKEVLLFQTTNAVRLYGIGCLARFFEGVSTTC